MKRLISTKDQSAAATQPATVAACQQDRAGRDEDTRAAEASVQRALAQPNGSFTARGRA